MNDIFQLTLILLASLIATILCRRIKIPAVIGQMLIGIVLSPNILGWIHAGHTINFLSEIGVIFLMFLAGLESNIQVLRKNLKSSILIAITGVLIPFIVFWPAAAFLSYNLDTRFFYGIIFAATSVSITVEVLQEYGKLSSEAGSIILGAAVVDDILAILLLSIFTSIGHPATSSGGAQNLFLKFSIEILFLIFLVLVHWMVPKLWIFVEKIPIYAKNTSVALILCLGLSLLANAAGLSAVIGSFFAGIAISQTPVSRKIAEYSSAIGYVIFIPVFFVSIALSVKFDSLIKQFWIVFLFVLLAILTKFLPGFLIGKNLLKLENSSSLLIGTGMVSRGEMALIIAQIGLSAHVVTSSIYSELVIVIILTTLIAPFLMKGVLRSSPRT